MGVQRSGIQVRATSPVNAPLEWPRFVPRGGVDVPRGVVTLVSLNRFERKKNLELAIRALQVMPALHPGMETHSPVGPRPVFRSRTCIRNRIQTLHSGPEFLEPSH